MKHVSVAASALAQGIQHMAEAGAATTKAHPMPWVGFGPQEASQSKSTSRVGGELDTTAMQHISLL